MDRESYQTASQLFVRRDFAKVQEELGPNGPGPSIEGWVLYLALCDRAFVEPDKPEWPYSDVGRKQLRVAMLKSLIWTEMEIRWAAVKQMVPTALILSSLKLSHKHKADPRPIITFMEQYIAQKSLPANILETFILEILIGLQNDFYYAKELVQNHPELRQTQLLEKIANSEKDYEAHLMEELNLQKTREDQRIAEAIAASSEKFEDAPEPTINGESESTLESNSENSSNSRDMSPRTPREKHTLVQLWSQWARQFIRSQGFYNAIILILFLSILATSRRAQYVVARGTQWLWKSLSSTLKMGLRVTYL